MKRFVKPLIVTGGSVLLSALMATASQAAIKNNAQNNVRQNWYATLSGDLTWLRHSDTGGGGNIALGYRIDDFRIEAEAGYHGAGGEDGYGSTRYFSYMGNVYYDMNNIYTISNQGRADWNIMPYIGGGIGDAAIRVGNSSFTNAFHHHDNKFAYQGMAGLSLVSASMPNTVLSLGYRYLGTSSDNIRSNNLEVSARFNF